MALTFTIDQTQYFENGITPSLQTVGAISYYRVSNGARQKWTTSARRMWVSFYAEYSSLDNHNGRIGLLVDGVPYFFGAPQATGDYRVLMRLPVGANKTVQLLVPLAFASSAGGAVTGVYPYFVQFDADATQVAPSLRVNHCVGYGDSIMSGGVAICPSLFGYAGRFKKDEANGTTRSFTTVSYGTRRLNDDCVSALAAAAFATALAALSPTELLIAIGSNDHSVIPAISAATHGTQYGYLLDALHAAMPTVPIICVTPIRRGQEAVAVTFNLDPTNTVNLTAHGMPANLPIKFAGTTAPTGLTNGTVYYVKTPTANAFAVSATPGGTAITLTGSPVAETLTQLNANNEAMADFRTQQTNAVNDVTRQGWAVPPVVHDGLAIFSDLSQFGTDLVHPNTTGNATLKTAIAAWIT